MTSKRTNVGSPGPTRRFARGLLVAWILAGPLPATVTAAESTPYQATVVLQGATEADRAAAFGEALKVAAVRASGRPEAATTARIVSAAGEPSNYVQQYSTTADHMLKVGFDERAMEQLLLQAGLPIWPSERPTVNVLLFSSSVAGGARAVTAGDPVPERLEVERAAQLRGIPVAWPTEALDLATARARLGSERAALLGVGSGGAYEWVFMHAGQTARSQGGVRQAVDAAADALAARYAPPSTRSVSMVQLRIGGLAGLRDYAALTEYLGGLSLVRSVNVRQLQRDLVKFELAVRGDAELLRRVLALDGRLAPVPESAAGAAGAVDYLWHPS